MTFPVIQPGRDSVAVSPRLPASKAWHMSMCSSPTWVLSVSPVGARHWRDHSEHGTISAPKTVSDDC